MMEIFTDKSKGAEISECGDYRYRLWRVWNDNLPKVLFIMLNPSTADADTDDPTIRRCINFAKSWGYGGLYVGNLFAYRSTSPKGLFDIDDPFGEFNNYHQTEMADECDLIVCAWGNAPILKKLKYYPKLENIKKPLHYIDLAKDGTPKHPLYLKGDLKAKMLMTPDQLEKLKKWFASEEGIASVNKAFEKAKENSKIFDDMRNIDPKLLQKPMTI